MEIILEHIKWIFSGIGVIVLSAIARIIYNKCKKNINVDNSKWTEIRGNENIDIKVSSSEDTIIVGNKS